MRRLDPKIILSILAILLGAAGIWFSIRKDQTVDEFIAGFSVVTGYRTTLSSSITSTAATINVASTNDRAGNAIDFSILGGRAYFTIEPGTAREEIVVCSGIGTNQWTGCTRGLSFQGTSRAASATLQFAHNAGVPMVMSNVSYVYEELVDKTATSTYEEYLGGTYVYTSSSPIYFGSSGTGLNCATSFRDGSVTSALPRVCFDNTNNYWVAYDDGVTSYRLASSTGGFNSGRGILITAGVVDIATTTTRYPGLAFYTEASVQRLGIATSTDISGWGISASSTGMFLSASTTSYSGLRFSANGVGLEFSGQVTSLNINQYVSASSTAVTSTFANIELGRPGNVIIGTLQSAATSTSATTTLTGNLEVSGNINQTGTYFGATAVAIGTFTRDLTVADATVFYSHTLGQTPSLLAINCHSFDGSTGDTVGGSYGYFVSGGTENSSYWIKEADAGEVEAGADGSNIIHILENGANDNGEVGNVSAATSTGFSIAYTETEAVSATIGCNFMVMR